MSAPTLVARIAGVAALALVVAATTVACSQGGPAPAGSGAAAVSGAPAGSGAAASGSGSGSAGSAAIEGARCLDDTHAEVTGPGGVRTQTVCGDDAVCVGGACAPLAVPASLGGGAIERGRLLRFTGPGWIGAWTQLGPFDRAQVDGFVKSPRSVLDDAKNGGARAVCSPGGRVDVRPRGGGHVVLAGLLVSARAQRVWLRVGVAGKARVWVASEKAEKVIELSRTQGLAAMPDEAVEPAQLAAGPNLILVDLEGTEDTPPSMWLRVRDDAQQSPADVAFAPASAKAGCSAASLVALDVTRTVTDDGLDLAFAASLRGLAPRGAEEIPWQVELKAKKVVAVADGKIASAELEGAAGASFAAHVAPASGNKQSVRLTLGAAGATDERMFPIHLRKKLFPRVAALSKALAALPASVPAGSRESFTRDVEEIARATAEGHPDESWITKRLEGAEALAEGFARGEDAYRAKTGVVFRAYRSELDGQLQPYVAYIPPTHKPDGAPLPMIVSFHGLTHQGEHALRAVIGQATKEDQNPDSAARHLPGFSNMGAILVAPWGFGKAGPRPLGEADVLRVIEEMKAAYRVDETRVSITGYSLGGTVAFALPLHYPSIFSAAAPLCGYPNLTSYNSVKDVRHTEFEEAMIARRFLGNYAANGRHVPMHIVHGGQDGPGRSKVIADRYKALGYPVIFDVQKELGHNVWDHAYEDGHMITWLKKKQQPKPPNQVRLVTGEYRYDRAHWVRLLGMVRSPGTPGAKVEKTESIDTFADIDAQMDWPAKALRVTTKNVESFSIDVAALGPPKGTTVTVDGTSLALDETLKEAFFEKGEAAWTVSGTEPARAGKKRAGVSGPLDDVLRHRQLIVYGTQDPAQTEANRVVADHFSSADHWAAARFPIKADRDVTEAELTGRSLVLIGGPASNRVTALFAASLPVTFEAGALVFRGKRHEGEDVGVSFIHPHPRDSNEYVVLHAGTTFRGTLASRHLPQLAPDFLVYDKGILAMRGELLLDRRTVRDGGFFGESWK